MATKEELIAQGFDPETAALLAQANAEGTGGTLPFPVLKFSYDQEDILIDEGVKKGNLISGWNVDKKTLTIKESGTDHGNKADLIVVASVFQCSHFDIQTNSTDAVTDIFYSSFDTPKMVDKKSGRTVKDLKDSGIKMKFTNILLLLMKDGKEWKPYIHYMHGTSYNNFYAQTEELGVKSIPLQQVFSVQTKKVPTNFQPAWTFEIKKVTPRNLTENVAEVSSAMKEFNKWIEKTNAGEVETPRADVPQTPAPAGQQPDIDINEDEIPF